MKISVDSNEVVEILKAHFANKGITLSNEVSIFTNISEVGITYIPANHNLVFNGYTFDAQIEDEHFRLP